MRPDPVLSRLAELPLAPPSSEFSESLRTVAHARLLPRRVHPAWTLAVALSVASYLGWALAFSSSLY